MVSSECSIQFIAQMFPTLANEFIDPNNCNLHQLTEQTTKKKRDSLSKATK